ncbi:MAG: response regulator, partial [Deltaproteobacteria bacterium]|nr:response regulator [Deltaproteobacteria bacterium]
MPVEDDDMNGPLRILIIEDRPAEADRLGALLTQAAGRACIWDRAPDLTHARQALSGLNPDAILLDTTLPEANGVEALRALGPWTELSAVLTLGSAESTPDGLPFLAAGAQDHLDAAALDAPTLWTRIRYAVERHHRQRVLHTKIDVLNGILSTIPEAVLVVAPDGSIRLCNPGARALLDFAAGPEAALGPLRSEPSLLDRAALGETVDDLRITCPYGSPGQQRHYAATLRP